MVAGEEIAHSKGEKQVAVRACGRLYQDLVRRLPVLYYGAPAGSGILFDVKYYDSVDAAPAGAPVVCLLHGAPGSYQDFASLINSLTQRGLRVVAPNFPDYNATYQHGFRHSPRERLDFLLEFFKAVKVDAIDMLIGHSASVYTLFELLEYSLAGDVSRWRTSSGDFQPAIRSVGLFSTPSYKLPRNLAVTPLRLFTLKLFDYRIMRPLILACIGWWVRIQGIKNRVDVDKIEDFLMAASTVGYSEYGKMRDRLHLLGQFRIPALLVYGKRDRLIPARVFASLEESLAGGAARVKSYDEHGEQVGAPEPAETAPVDVSRFEEGGHYVFQRYASQVNGDVLDFLQRRVLQRG